MREIEFRGLNTRGEWVYGSLVQTTSFCVQHSKTWIVERAFGNGGWFNVQCRQYVRPATVGQFTGLRDKSGVEIYEGDIWKSSENGIEEIGVVEYHGCAFRVKYGDTSDLLGLAVQYGEVIGNIHENPGLLEQQPCG